ncbi:hypothetical protein [Streptomyces lydicus]|uniref:hypothetical protein n=1 Tax=Streptomyces lydicus TaxID=47763 RepID=UPI0013E93BB6|nr:hypothetical protein [Streptomyces lydicus]
MRILFALDEACYRIGGCPEEVYSYSRLLAAAAAGPLLCERREFWSEEARGFARGESGKMSSPSGGGGHRVGYELQAVIAGDEWLRAASGDVPGARVAPLRQGLLPMRMTDEVFDAVTDGSAAEALGFRPSLS